ncbi:hypothetical protein [Singulisphaera acidiphila]|uniref:DUF4352 domain-containing protein n=1 Tax=Singulisphaera acidiphila (strain ATCC BAA-1392 / DSM 18658 / VKM B-2454 / MOB10) TaxID=886293 RepID=L0DP79_SINAD|nr:hypothetical protein [Singulisphaera acidiphila]AGA30653.1 hypothetical protein Sinac_6578 [Singulisphaera acidiphila DSM 18658]
MSSETHDPALGAHRSDSSDSGLLGPGGPPATEGGNDPSVPLAPYSSSSGDELNKLLTESIAQPAPDPFLGAFSTEAEPHPAGESDPTDPIGPTAPEASAHAAAPSHLDPEALEFPQDLKESSLAEIPKETGAAGSFDALSALAALTGLTPSESSVEPEPEFQAPLMTGPVESGPPKASHPEEDDDDDDDASQRGRSWPTLLLFSYASAVTLGLLWVLFSGRKLREGDEADLFPASENRLDPGRRADQSRKWVPPQPIAADHLATFGQAIRIGSLEVTPLEITLGPVGLEQAFGGATRRDGGSGALRLKLKLKNVSSDTIFVPLDEVFIRERDQGGPDSFIETAKGGPIAMYPLAVESEWSIRGQTFKELQPGESCEALLVSAPDVSDRLSSQMTWRIRLRTGIDRTDTLGVRFGQDAIRPGA